MRKVLSTAFLAFLTVCCCTALGQTYTPGQNQANGSSSGRTSFYTPKPIYQDNSVAPSNPSQDQQSTDSMQSLIAQEQQNLNGQIQHLQSMPNQVQQSELQTQQTLTERNEHIVSQQPYSPPPATAYAAPAAASDDTALPATGCITGFYNPQIYGWWNWKNNCSFSVAVFSQLRNAAYGGENTVIPGNLQSGNTGLSPDELNAGGGYVYAACPDGYTAIDNATGQLWTRNTVSFHCNRS